MHTTFPSGNNSCICSKYHWGILVTQRSRSKAIPSQSLFLKGNPGKISSSNNLLMAVRSHSLIFVALTQVVVAAALDIVQSVQATHEPGKTPLATTQPVTRSGSSCRRRAFSLTWGFIDSTVHPYRKQTTPTFGDLFIGQVLCDLRVNMQHDLHI